MSIISRLMRLGLPLFSIVLFSACATSPAPKPAGSSTAPADAAGYLIGPGDNLQVFVWRNQEISVTVPVRPDGKISTPLVEDMVAVGKTPTQLARDIEQILGKYIRTPVVTVIVTGFIGTFGEQIRVVGQAANPKALSYRERITLLDVMIEVGGLGQFAAGNRAKIVRRWGGQQTVIPVRLDDLVKRGDVSANVGMRPGDILVIPETRF